MSLGFFPAEELANMNFCILKNQHRDTPFIISDNPSILVFKKNFNTNFNEIAIIIPIYKSHAIMISNKIKRSSVIETPKNEVELINEAQIVNAFKFIATPEKQQYIKRLAIKHSNTLQFTSMTLTFSSREEYNNFLAMYGCSKSAIPVSELQSIPKPLSIKFDLNEKLAKTITHYGA